MKTPESHHHETKEAQQAENGAGRWDALRAVPFAGEGQRETMGGERPSRVEAERPSQMTKGEGRLPRVAAERSRESNAEQALEATSLKEFYQKIENPLEDAAVMDELTKAYARMEDGKNGFYKALVEIGVDDKETGKMRTQERQKFEGRMFGQWRESVVGMTQEEFLEARQAGTLGDDFRLLHNFVKKHPECRTNRELREKIGAIDDQSVSDALFDALWTYGWSQAQPGWTHVKSRNVNAKRGERIKVEHRFYINTDSTDTHEALNALVDAYEQKQMPYYFKFDERGERADTIVIYASTQGLKGNLEVLQQLQEEHPDLVKRMHRPPVLTGRVGEKFGYGAEPEQARSSYNSVRAELIEKAFNRVTLEWVERHQGDMVRSNGETMPFSEYMVGKEVAHWQKKMKERMGRRAESIWRQEKQAGRAMSIEQAYANAEQELGYLRGDLQDGSKMLQAIGRGLEANFEARFKALRGPREAWKAEDLEMKLRNGQTMTLGMTGMTSTIRGLAPQIAAHDPNYISAVRGMIMTGARAAGIGSKFVF